MGSAMVRRPSGGLDSAEQGPPIHSPHHGKVEKIGLGHELSSLHLRLLCRISSASQGRGALLRMKSAAKGVGYKL